MKEYETRGYVTEIDPRTGKRVTHRVKKLVCRYTEAERISIVREYLISGCDVQLIMDKYHIRSKETFFSWLGTHIKEAQSLSLQEINRPETDMANKSKDDQIRELKEKLRQAEKRADREALRAKAFSTMIDVAEETFNIPVRKKSGTKQ